MPIMIWMITSTKVIPLWTSFFEVVFHLHSRCPPSSSERVGDLFCCLFVKISLPNFLMVSSSIASLFLVFHHLSIIFPSSSSTWFTCLLLRILNRAVALLHSFESPKQKLSCDCSKHAARSQFELASKPSPTLDGKQFWHLKLTILITIDQSFSLICYCFLPVKYSFNASLSSLLRSNVRFPPMLQSGLMLQVLS